MVAQSIHLGPQETRLLFSLEERDIGVFSTGDAKKILGTGQAACSVLSGLQQKGRVRRIEKGRYMLVPARAGLEGYWSEDYGAIVPLLADEYYVAFLTAMDYWDMTEQFSYTIFIAAPKRRKNPVVKFENLRYQFVTLSEKKFFGVVESDGNAKFSVSCREKTIVDGLMHPQYCGGIPEVAKAMWNARDEVDWDKVVEMAERVKVGVVLQRLGYLADEMGIGGGIGELIRPQVKQNPYQCLDPDAGTAKISTSSPYRLTINMTAEDLLGWVDT